MLKCRVKAMEQLNQMYDLEINVDFGSVWAKSSKEVIDDKINPDENGSELETEKTGQGEKEELEQILNDPNSSDEDKQTAQELLDELEQSSNE